MLRTLLIVMLLFAVTQVMAAEEARTITVNGAGFAEVEPDRANVRMSIVAREKTLDAAQKQAANVSAKVLQMTERLGLKRDKVDTTGTSVRPDYRWNRDKEEQELRGYISERQIHIEIDELDKLGALIEGAVSAGVNQVSPPQLDSSKRKDAYRQALRMAAEDARANAAALSATLGATLGPVLSVNSGSNAPRPPTPYAGRMQAMASDAVAAESYNAADLSFSATVTVVFELAD